MPPKRNDKKPTPIKAAEDRERESKQRELEIDERRQRATLHAKSNKIKVGQPFEFEGKWYMLTPDGITRVTIK